MCLMATSLTANERALLKAARSAMDPKSRSFNWQDAADSIEMAHDDASEALKGLKRGGFVTAIGFKDATLTTSGVRVADGGTT